MKKKARSPAVSKEPAQSSSAASGKVAKVGKPSPTKPSATGDTALTATKAVSSPAAALGEPEIKKIQGLLKAKTVESASLGLSLLESLGATQSDYEAIFTEPVKKAISRLGNDWWQGGEETRGEYERYHRAVVRPAYVALAGRGTEAKKPFIDLVDIPAGAFTMGSPETEADRSCDETQVAVRITKPFGMGRTVVTQGQWRAVMGTEPWRPAWAPRSCGGLKKNQCGDNFPAVFVGWNDAVHFCQTLTDLERKAGRLTAAQSYRLPTEAEWEYACRAGTKTAYSFGDNPSMLDDHGWNSRNSGRVLHEVAGKKPNPWGLYDMHGNVFEWCMDFHGSKLSGGNDPQGPSAGSLRVRRGGSWNYQASHCRSAFRFSNARGIRLDYYGFRVVRV